MPTPKTYKPRPCEANDCGIEFTPVRFGQTACQPKCAIKVAQQRREKQENREWNAEKKVLKEKLKKKSEWEADLQKLVNKLARLIDHGHPCISSQRMDGKRDGGHYYSRGSHPTIRFHLMNVYSQTAEQNNNQSGNPVGYREGLISTFGIEHMEYVESLKAHPPIKLSVEELKEKIRIARGCVKEMEQTISANNKLSTRSRLVYRNMYNKKLNIYQY